MHDSDACVKAQCKRNLKFTTMFHLDLTVDDAYRHIQCMNFSIACHIQCMNTILAENHKFFLPPSHSVPLIRVTPFEFMEKLY